MSEKAYCHDWTAIAEIDLGVALAFVSQTQIEEDVHSIAMGIEKVGKRRAMVKRMALCAVEVVDKARMWIFAAAVTPLSLSQKQSPVSPWMLRGKLGWRGSVMAIAYVFGDERRHL